MIMLAVSTHALIPNISLKPLPDPHRTMIPMTSYARTQQPSVSFLLRYWTISRYMDVLYLSLAEKPVTPIDETTEITADPELEPSIEPETDGPEQLIHPEHLPGDPALLLLTRQNCSLTFLRRKKSFQATGRLLSPLIRLTGHDFLFLCSAYWFRLRLSKTKPAAGQQ
jgi:hypothetical protein